MAKSRNMRRQPQTHNRYGQRYNGTQEFVCLHCGLYVAFDPQLAGVQNRNHCPYCLWSRHLDWQVAGDRLSNCRAGMRPIGLTTKRGRNKYARERDGELMLIHRCTGCGEVTLNRIAADDLADTILAVFEQSVVDTLGLDDAEFVPLTAQERGLVCRRLFGSLDDHPRMASASQRRE